jgi:hypothetical protein
MPAIHGAKIPVVGKGSVGKTMVCAVLSQLFVEVAEVFRPVEERLTGPIAERARRDS